MLEVAPLLTIVWEGAGLAAKGATALGELPEMARLTAALPEHQSHQPGNAEPDDQVRPCP